MKNLLLTAGVFAVAFLLAGTDLWPCGTHAASLLNYGGDATLLAIAGENDLSRQKRQIRGAQENTGFIGRKSRVAPVPSAPFTAEYLEKSRMIFHAHQILYGPLWELQEQFPNTNRDDSADLSKVLNYFKHWNQNTLPDNLKRKFPEIQLFHQMYHMRNEVSHQSYSVACFDSDKKALIAVAKYLDGVSSGGSGGSWQTSRTTARPSIRNRQTLELAITSALGYSGRSSTSSANNNQCSRPASFTTGNNGGSSQTSNLRRTTLRPSNPGRLPGSG